MSHAKHIATRPVDGAMQQALQNAGANPLLAKLYAARHINKIEEISDDFSQLLPYTQLKNCTAAAERLAQAIEQQERILIIADYDADGATACSVGMKGLSAMGAIVDYFVPNRFEHGYGLTPQLADIAYEMGANLIVTVDNGISSYEGVARAREWGIDTVITDHHSAGSHLPNCIIVNPNQKDCPFPSKNLAGVGVIFYVLIALRALLRQKNHFNEQHPEPKLNELLDLVALGTVADVVPLDHNNRILVSQGLKRIRSGKMSPGIQALFEVTQRDPNKAQPFDMGFGLAPRINAAGRLDDMSIGIACLLSDNLSHASEIAEQLNRMNRSRQEIEHSMLQNVFNHCPDTLPTEQTTLVVYHTDFHQGVIGIVASRLKEQFYRPTFVFAPSGDGEMRGSGRSIVGVHLRDMLDAVTKRCPDMIIKFGGHAMAAGLTLRASRFDEFCRVFEQVVREIVNEEILSQTYLTDGSLDNKDLTIAQTQLINNQVWGQGFAPPSFNDTFRVMRQQAMGKNQKHIKAWLKKDQRVLEAMFWNTNETLPEHIQIVYHPVVNEWRGNQELQLYVDYWRAV